MVTWYVEGEENPSDAITRLPRCEVSQEVYEEDCRVFITRISDQELDLPKIGYYADDPVSEQEAFEFKDWYDKLWEYVMKERGIDRS